jgi:ATP-binding protein involved in chromosome partitioning
MAMTKQSLTEVVSKVPGPDGCPLSESGVLLGASVCDGMVKVRVRAHAGWDEGVMSRVASSVREAVARYAATEHAALVSCVTEFVGNDGNTLKAFRFGGAAASGTSPRAGHTPIPGLDDKSNPLAGVRHIIAVGAGKGGVGKSTIALNLAVGLARRGLSVGLLDADIYGPSMPTMLGLGTHDAIVHQGMLQPFFTHGVKCMTIGKLVDPDKPLIWRGPMAHGAFTQLAEQTQWGELDYLVIDLPPGTGDVSLTMAQTLSLTGAVVVCTPQKVAQDDAVRAARMFEALKVPVLGVVENMSCFVGDDGKVYDIFGRGGAKKMSERLGVPFLGEVPITMSLREHSDRGDPTANFTGTHEAGKRLGKALEELVSSCEAQVALATMKRGGQKPTLTIS